MTLRLLTYNIHHAEGNDNLLNARRIAEVIRESGADLVGLNEVYHPYPAAPGQPPMLASPMLDEIADALGMGYVFGSAIPTIPGSTLQAPYGNALLSRYPWRKASTYRLPAPETRESRGVIWAEVEVNGTPLTFGIVHLENRTEQVRLEQIEHLLPVLAQLRQPRILVGDFNAVAPGEYLDSVRKQIAPPAMTQVIARMLAAEYVDAQSVVGRGPRESWSSTHPIMRIDYVWLSPELQPKLVSCERWDTPLSRMASDHFPVLCELDI
jgi:endonuclease/exonuclease/phosphatase family metal-dependent hydrolase